MEEVGTIKGVGAAWISNYYLSQKLLPYLSPVEPYTRTLLDDTF
jgi:hypothetical protein